MISKNKGGYHFEDFVKSCYTEMNKWISSIPEIKDSYILIKGVQLPTYNSVYEKDINEYYDNLSKKIKNKKWKKTSTNQIDVYYQYTEPNGITHKVAIECKKLKDIEVKEIRDFNAKLENITNIKGIFVFSGHLQKGVIECAKEQNIQLLEFEELIQAIELNINPYIEKYKTDIKIIKDEQWYENNNIQEKMSKFSNNSAEIIGILLDNESHYFKGELYNNLFKYFENKNFIKTHINNKTFSYKISSENLFLMTENKELPKIKAKTVEFIFEDSGYWFPTITNTINVGSGKIAYIKNILTGKEEILLENGTKKEIKK